MAVTFRLCQFAQHVTPLCNVAGIGMGVGLFCRCIAVLSMFMLCDNRQRAHNRSVFIQTGIIMLMYHKICHAAKKRSIAGIAFWGMDMHFICTGKGHRLFIATFSMCMLFYGAAVFLHRKARKNQRIDCAKKQLHRLEQKPPFSTNVPDEYFLQFFPIVQAACYTYRFPTFPVSSASKISPAQGIPSYSVFNILEQILSKYSRKGCNDPLFFIGIFLLKHEEIHRIDGLFCVSVL